MVEWMNGTETETKVVVVQNGEKEEQTFDSSKTLKEVVEQISESKHFKAILVRVDGKVVSDAEAKAPVSNFKEVEIMPKHVGA